MLHATIHAIAADANLTALLRTELLPLPLRFEAAATALEALPRMYFEPDGSFVWVSDDPALAWQIDGQLQDRGACLDHVEIKGTCSAAAFKTLLNLLRTGNVRLAFHLLPEDRFVDEAVAAQLVRCP